MQEQHKFTLLHRLLHWTMAIALPALFITGFLRMYWMNKSHISGIIQGKSNTIPKEQVSEIASAIREPMWEWHEIFAYVMIAAFIIRIGYMLLNGVRFPNPFKAGETLKERFQGFTYIYFYLFVFISAFTGMSIHYDWFSGYHELLETVHKWGIYWFPIFIILHLVGVVIAENSAKKGITSKMIGGD